MSSLCKCFDKITGVSANGVIFLRIRISSFWFSQRSETANSMMFTSTTNLVWQLFCFECIMPCWSEISLQTGTDWWSWGLDSRFWGIKGLFYCFFSRLSCTNELQPLSRGAVLKWVWWFTTWTKRSQRCVWLKSFFRTVPYSLQLHELDLLTAWLNSPASKLHANKFPIRIGIPWHLKRLTNLYNTRGLIGKLI